MVVIIMGIIIAILLIACGVQYALLTKFRYEYDKLLEENALYHRTVYEQSSIRNTCRAAFQSLMDEASRANNSEHNGW